MPLLVAVLDKIGVLVGVSLGMETGVDVGVVGVPVIGIVAAAETIGSEVGDRLAVGCLTAGAQPVRTKINTPFRKVVFDKDMKTSILKPWTNYLKD